MSSYSCYLLSLSCCITHRFYAGVQENKACSRKHFLKHNFDSLWNSKGQWKIWTPLGTRRQLGLHYKLTLFLLSETGGKRSWERLLDYSKSGTNVQHTVKKTYCKWHLIQTMCSYKFHHRIDTSVYHLMTVLLGDFKISPTLNSYSLILSGLACLQPKRRSCFGHRGQFLILMKDTSLSAPTYCHI